MPKRERRKSSVGRPDFLSGVKIRRALQTRLLSVDPNATRIRSVRVKRIGGFGNRSYKLRFVVSLKKRDGSRRLLTLRGSNERRDETRRQAYEIMKFLFCNGFARGPWQIARPVTFFRRWKLLVYEEAPGKTLRRLLREQPERAGEYLARTARWLAALHCHAPNLHFAYNRTGRKYYWRAALTLFSTMEHRDYRRIERAIRRVMRFEDVLAATQRRALVHHDFHPGNVLIARSTVRVVDFTESRLSDPRVDIATFVAQLEQQLGRFASAAQIEKWQGVFLRAYRRVAPSVALSTPTTKRIFRFIRFRIALQSFVGEYMLGKRRSPFRDLVIHPHWYHA